MEPAMEHGTVWKWHVLAMCPLLSGAAHAWPTDEAHCIEASARYNRLPPALLLAIRQQEGGQVGRWRLNTDGSIDYGVMQINSLWLPLLRRRGYDEGVLTYDACASIAAGAWILTRALAAHQVWNQSDADPRRYWRAVGSYHSRTPRLNRIYAEQVWKRYRRALATVEVVRSIP